MAVFQQFAENTAGRDFVVGDLHGCRFMLEERLRQVNFDPAVDRVFSVGDLIDRGPDSLNTLSLILEPWFFPVLGNHEDMLLSWLDARHSEYHRPIHFIQNGGDWVMNLTADEKEFLETVLLSRLLEVPYLIRVEGANPFNVVHAELDLVARMRKYGSVAHSQPAPQITLAELADEDFLFYNRAHLTWGRSLAKEAMRQAYANFSPDWAPTDLGGEGLSDGSITYAGHSIVAYPLKINGHVFLDGGAFMQTYDEAERPVLGNRHLGNLYMFNHTEGRFV